MPLDLPYRQGVGIVLINSQKKIFAAKRIDNTADAWQMPQGGIDEGEDPEAAAFRELEEETGVTGAKIISRIPDWISYDLPEELAIKLWRGKYKGQTQKWFLMQFTGGDQNINIATKNPEFSEWKWLEPEVIVELIVDFKKELYRKVLKEFGSYL